MRRRILIGLCLLGSFVGACRRPLIDSDAAKGIADRVAAGDAPGAVAAVFDAKRVQYRSFGVMRVGQAQAPDEHTLYGVGSITKLYTDLLLADMVSRGELELEDPAEKWIKPALRTPRLKGRTFTLLDLATHRSGLGRDVTYSEGFSQAQLTAMLPHAALLSPPGDRFIYSNLGVSVLGRALADRAGLPYGALLSQRVLEPLGLSESFLSVPPALAARFAQGLQPPLDNEVTLPCGGLKASAADLVRFLRQNFGQAPSPLHDAMALMQVPRPGREPITLGWFLWQTKKGPVYGHSGLTPGSRAYALFRPSDGRGVVLLHNSTADMQDLAMELLDPVEMLHGDWSSRATVDGAALDKLAGRYAFKDGGSVVISTRPDGLSAQVLGSFDLWEFDAQGPQDFVNEAHHTRMHFNLGPDGKALSVDYHQGIFDNLGAPRIKELAFILNGGLQVLSLRKPERPWERRKMAWQALCMNRRRERNQGSRLLEDAMKWGEGMTDAAADSGDAGTMGLKVTLRDGKVLRVKADEYSVEDGFITFTDAGELVAAMAVDQVLSFQCLDEDAVVRLAA